MKHLKNTFLFVITLSIGISVHCQNNQHASIDIKAYLDAYNAVCPIQQGIFTITGATFIDGSIIFDNIVDENAVDFVHIAENVQLFKQNKFNILAFVEEDDFLKELEQTKIGLTYRYTGNRSGDIVTISFTTEEIKQILSYSENPTKFLNSEVSNTNNVMPIKIDNIQTATKMAIENGYIVYYIEIDEDLYSLDKLKNIAANRKKKLLEPFQNPETPDYVIARACRKAQYGIEYRYIGNKSKTIFSIKIECNEL